MRTDSWSSLVLAAKYMRLGFARGVKASEMGLLRSQHNEIPKSRAECPGLLNERVWPAVRKRYNTSGENGEHVQELTTSDLAAHAGIEQHLGFRCPCIGKRGGIEDSDLRQYGMAL